MNRTLKLFVVILIGLVALSVIWFVVKSIFYYAVIAVVVLVLYNMFFVRR